MKTTAFLSPRSSLLLAGAFLLQSAVCIPAHADLFKPISGIVDDARDKGDKVWKDAKDKSDDIIEDAGSVIEDAIDKAGDLGSNLTPTTPDQDASRASFERTRQRELSLFKAAEALVTHLNSNAPNAVEFRTLFREGKRDQAYSLLYSMPEYETFSTERKKGKYQTWTLGYAGDGSVIAGIGVEDGTVEGYDEDGKKVRKDYVSTSNAVGASVSLSGGIAIGMWRAPISDYEDTTKSYGIVGALGAVFDVSYGAYFNTAEERNDWFKKGADHDGFVFTASAGMGLEIFEYNWVATHMKD